MRQGTLNYYGFTKETYKNCESFIRQSNRKNCLALTGWFLVVNLLYLVFASLNLFGTIQQHVFFYAAVSGITVLCVLPLIFLPDFCERHSTFVIYISIVIILLYCISVSVLQRYIPAIMFLLFLSLIGVTYTDVMHRMSFTLCFFSVLFVLSSFYFKTFSIAYYDTYNVLVVLVLAIGLHYIFQRMRLQQFVLFLKDAQIQRELEKKSSVDSLSALMTRDRFFSYYEVMEKAHHGEYLSLCLIDLDGFKEINDTFGHQMGDKVIQLTGKTILQTLAIPTLDEIPVAEWNPKLNVSFAGRLGGDEFIIVLVGKKNRAEARSVLETILHNLNTVQLESITGIQASLGVTEIKADDIDIDGAYKRADDALYQSKRAGKNKITFSECGE